MKNIIIFCNSSWNIYNFRANLIKKISLDYSVQTISGKDKFSNKIKNLSKSNNINMQNRSMNIFQNFKEILKVRKIIKKKPNNILINFSNKSAIIGTLASFFFENKIINVITGLGSTFTNKNFFKKNFIKFLYIIVNLKTDYFVTQNPNDFKFFKEFLFIKKKKIKLIKGSGIDGNKFFPKKKEKNFFINFLFIGRILNEKGIFNFLESAQYFEKNFKNIKFTVIGEKENKHLNAQEIKKFKNLTNLKNVKYYNFQSNIYKFISDCDCIILPSFREGLSRALLEASAMEKFIICSNVPGCKEIVRNNFNGYLIKPNDTKDLIKKIKNFIKLPKSRIYKMEKNSRRRTLSLYSDEIVIKKYLKLINDIKNKKFNK